VAKSAVEQVRELELEFRAMKERESLYRRDIDERKAQDEKIREELRHEVQELKVQDEKIREELRRELKSQDEKRREELRREAEEHKVQDEKRRDENAELRRELAVARQENAVLKQQLTDHVAQYQEWDRRRWGLIMLLIGAVLSLASGLIATLARK